MTGLSGVSGFCGSDGVSGRACGRVLRSGAASGLSPQLRVLPHSEARGHGSGAFSAAMGTIGTGSPFPAV
ncbi:hypothetical protein [Halocynthiibacter sp.]|uniref:hypothetical protein n=1 Tax=Halocynthiibacter sp. TaxID=1979210 RepID=UPI003C427591